MTLNTLVTEMKDAYRKEPTIKKDTPIILKMPEYFLWSIRQSSWERSVFSVRMPHMLPYGISSKAPPYIHITQPTAITAVGPH